MPISRRGAFESWITADIPERIHLPPEAGRVEDPVQLGRIALHSMDPTQHLSGALSVILPLSVCPMHLVVVVRHELFMRGDELAPALRVAHVPIGYAALHIE